LGYLGDLGEIFEESVKKKKEDEESERGEYGVKSLSLPSRGGSEQQALSDQRQTRRWQG